MHPIVICVALLMLSIVMENCEAGGGGGSVAVNIGAYITLYKARKKAKEEAARRKIKTTRRTTFKPTRWFRNYYDGSNSNEWFY